MPWLTSKEDTCGCKDKGWYPKGEEGEGEDVRRGGRGEEGEGEGREEGEEEKQKRGRGKEGREGGRRGSTFLRIYL